MKHHTLPPPKKPTKHTGKGAVGNLGTLFIRNETISLVIFVLFINLTHKCYNLFYVWNLIGTFIREPWHFIIQYTLFTNMYVTCRCPVHIVIFTCTSKRSDKSVV